MIPFWRAIAAGGCLTLLLNACGGGGSAPAPVTPPPTGNTPPPPVQLHAEAIAGQPGVPPRYANGTLATAQFYMPAYARPQLAVDKSGNLYVADSNAVVRKITPAGQVSLLAGTVGHFGATDGTGADALLPTATGMVADAAGNLYLSSRTAIRKITPAGVVTTLAGQEGSSYQQDGAGTQAHFSYIYGLSIDAAGNLYVADGTLRRVSPSGVVATVKLENGPSAVMLVAVDPKGGLTVSDQDNRVWRFDAAGKLQQTIGQSNTGSVDGSPDQTYFGWIQSMVYAPNGVLYTVEKFAFTDAIRKVDTAGNTTILHSGLLDSGLVDGPLATTARLSGALTGANALVLDGSGNLFLAEAINHAIRKITPDGQVSTYAGGWIAPPAFADGAGATAAFNNISSFTTDKAGNTYVADQGNCAVRKITPDHVVTTLAGVGGQCGEADGTGAAARFQNITGMTQDSSGNLYVAEHTTVRKVTPAGVVTTLAGSTGTSTKKDGSGAAASFQNLLGITIGQDGNLLVSDGNQGASLCNFDVDNSPTSLRTITPAGVVSTIAGTEWSCADRDKAPAVWAAHDVAFDGAGNLYLVSYGYLAKRAADGSAVWLLDSQGNKIAAEKLAPDDAGNVFFTYQGSVFRYGADHAVTRVLAPTGMNNPVEITPDLPVLTISALTYVGNHRFLASFDNQVVTVTLK